MRDFDVIVLGVGGIGSAALRALAERGVAACGIERFDVGHDRGSSHGDTRIIRKAYFEHPDYVPLLHRAYEGWDELEAACGERLFERCGFLTVGAPESASISGLEACYAAHDLPHERLATADLAARFPALVPEPGASGFFDPLGGYLRVEACVRRQASRARAAGAELITGSAVDAWRAGGDRVVVTVGGEELGARRLILCAGAWSVPELRRLGVKAQVWRKVVFWYRPTEPQAFQARVLPPFYVETDDGHFYGFPDVDDGGVKVAEHLAPTPIDDPDAVDRSLLPGDEEPVADFIERALPGLRPGPTRHSVCLYTVTPDWNFIIDRHPDHAEVVIAAGFSGHGFKFAPVVGEALADLALEGGTPLPIGFLGFDRFR